MLDGPHSGSKVWKAPDGHPPRGLSHLYQARYLCRVLILVAGAFSSGKRQASS